MPADTDSEGGQSQKCERDPAEPDCRERGHKPNRPEPDYQGKPAGHDQSDESLHVRTCGDRL
ncbi:MULTISPECIES: hypothetical protein [Haloarcula]|uniref:hypothetical protein n=1 Tax=Haloarcula TaxID=2237 RepID=UPI000B195D21|nr:MULTISPECIES: hypothetical protein [Haloarcula]